MNASLIYYFPMLMVTAFFVLHGRVVVPRQSAFHAPIHMRRNDRRPDFPPERAFDLYPSHPYFPSGHMTLCLCVALSLGIVRPWTLAITLPLLVFLGIGLVAVGFHTPIDVLGAVPVVLLVYAIAFPKALLHRFRPLDSRAGSY